MAEEKNQMRAMRLAEIIQDFRHIQHRIAEIHYIPRDQDKNGIGYKILDECAVESKAILDETFRTTQDAPDGDPEKERQQLQEVMLDACHRRLKAQRLFLRATAAMRWINGRNAILQDRAETESVVGTLRLVNTVLQGELAAITNERIVSELLLSDQQQGRWTDEDPTLAQMLASVASN